MSARVSRSSRCCRRAVEAGERPRSSNRSRPAWPSTSRKSCWLRAWNRSRTGICRCAWPPPRPSSSCRSARSPCRTCGAARSAIPCGMMSRANCSCVCWHPGRRSCACGRNWISWIYPVDGCLNGWAYAIARARLQRTGIPSTGTASRRRHGSRGFRRREASGMTTVTTRRCYWPACCMMSANVRS